MPNKDEVEIAAIYNELEDEVNLAVSSGGGNALGTWRIAHLAVLTKD
jgi:hypothetical protein